jgi:hypothetical protein
MQAISANRVKTTWNSPPVAREIIRVGATQIKTSTDGGVFSVYDPLGVRHYTRDGVEAFVEVAVTYITYVALYVSIDEAVRVAVEAGVKSPYEVMALATSNDAQLLELAGSRHPYQDFCSTWRSARRQATHRPITADTSGKPPLIVAIGAIMLWRAISAVLVGERYGTDGGIHSHGYELDTQHNDGCAACAAGAEPRNGGWIATAIGAVPCTSAQRVVMFGLASDLGLAATMVVIAISAGMAVAMSAFGVAFLWGRDEPRHDGPLTQGAP